MAAVPQALEVPIRWISLPKLAKIEAKKLDESGKPSYSGFSFRIFKGYLGYREENKKGKV